MAKVTASAMAADPVLLTEESSVPLSVAPENTRINNFDLVRLYGAGQVALIHALTHLYPAALPGIEAVLGLFPGVPIFFTVSGFLVSLSLERAGSVRQYFLNRALRIFPALWVCFAISVVIVVLAGVALPSMGRLLVWAGTQLTILQPYNPGWLREAGIRSLNGSLWTIPVELEFYALLPLLALWAGRNPRRWVVLTVLAGLLMIALRTFGPFDTTFVGKVVSVTVFPWLFYFLVGTVLRYVHTAYPSFFRGNALKFALIYVVWAGFERIVGMPGFNGNDLNPVSIILLSSLVISVAFTNSTLSSRVLGTTDISYGLYIYHMPLINLFLVKGVVGAGGAVGVLAATVALASASWLLIEKPALNLKHYTLKRRL